MEIRRATEKDLNDLMEIYAYARELMIRNGNPTQWSPSYPGKVRIREDIEKQICYVCVENGEIEGVFVYCCGPDPGYRRIDHGKWLNDAPYGVVHRLASRGRIRGVADFCLEWAFEKCRNLRIDTHRDNHAMRHILDKNGFIPCGTVYVEDGSSRIAYQKVKDKGYQEVLDFLKDEICAGRLKAGDRLMTERQMSEQLGVSRTTVRDAMRMLEGMGGLSSRQGSGNYLSGNMERSLSEMLQFMLLLKELDYRTINQLRRAVGMWAYQEVMEHHTPEQIENLKKVLVQMEKSQNPAASDQRFHEYLLECTGNTLMRAMMRPLSDVCEKLIEKAMESMTEEERSRLGESHAGMIEALEKGKAGEGYEAAKRHYDLVDSKIAEWKEKEQ